MPWTLRQYKAAFDDFYAGCDQDLREAIDERLAYLRLHGNMTGEPVSKPLGDSLFELRANTHRHQVRFLYFFSKGQIIVVVSAFFKKTRATPREEIAKALKRKKAIERGEETTNGSHYVH